MWEKSTMDWRQHPQVKAPFLADLLLFPLILLATFAIWAALGGWIRWAVRQF
jgi:hypothetical protein